MVPIPILPVGLLRRARAVQSLVLVSTLGFGVFATSADVECQSCGPVSHNETVPPSQGFFSVPAPAVCQEFNVVTDQTLPDRGFVKLNTTIRIDTETHTTGTCDYNTWDYAYNPPLCRLMQTENYLLMAATVWSYPPTQLASYQRVFANYGSQSLDTRNSYGLGTALSEAGEHRFTFNGTSYASSCTPAADSTIVEKYINGMSCEPVWWRGSKIFHVPPTTISVYVNPSMWNQLSGPANNAAQEWNTRLAGTGITIQVVDYDCGTSGDCIVVQEGSVDAGCAESLPPTTWDLNTGVTTSTRYMTLPTNPDRLWTLRNADRLKRTMGHELGHMLGLGDYKSACSSATPSAIMAPVTDCTSTSGVALSPTTNDALPALTPYRNPSSPVVRVCGF